MIYQPKWFWNYNFEEDKLHAHPVFKPSNTTAEEVICWFTVFISFLFNVGLLLVIGYALNLSKPFMKSAVEDENDETSIIHTTQQLRWSAAFWREDWA